MKIQVLGSGCSTCKKLFEITKHAVKELNLNEEVEYSTDVSQIIEMGVMSSPVLAIDGKPVLVGFTPDIEKIKKLLSAATSLSKKQVKSAGSNCKCTHNGNCHDGSQKQNSCRCEGNS